MLDELEKYKSNGHFFFTATSELANVCNAPKNGMGVYIVNELKNGNVELVYIGSSGKIDQNGNKKIRKGGIYDRLVHGIQFDKPRKESWKEKLVAENIEAFDVYWYETFDTYNSDIPSSIEGLLLQGYFDIYGKLPKWNKEF